ncbi:hypothetical protein ACTQ34_02810 [Agathobaculum sp. LCP25S3_E8]
MPSMLHFTNVLFSLIVAFVPMAIGLLLLYFVIKKAVKDAINESNRPKF